jgi:hypothetical protein
MKCFFKEDTQFIIVQFGSNPGFLDCHHEIQVVAKLLFANFALGIVEKFS